MARRIRSPVPQARIRTLTRALIPNQRRRELRVVKIGIKKQVRPQPISPLGRAPGSAKQPVDVRSDLGCRVIERKQGVKASALKLPLANDAPSSSRKPPVDYLRA